MVPPYFRFLLRVYAYAMVLSSAFRLLAATFIAGNLEVVEANRVLTAFGIGLRFDNVVACALIAIPFLFLSLLHFTGPRPGASRVATAPLYLLLPACFALQVFDLFYFQHFGVRTSAVVLNWADDLAFGVTMLAEEPAWMAGLGSGILATCLVAWPVRHWEKRAAAAVVPPRSWSWGLVCVLVMGALFLGIRGRVAIKSPIREGLAYFSDTPALNQLALNPVFTFGSSWIRARKYREKPLRFMPEAEATAIFRADLGLPPVSPPTLLRHAEGDGSAKNLVVVMLEGMSAHYTATHKKPSWTPVIDRLMAEGLAFTHAYSSGTHTYNGIWSTLFSFPSPYAAHPLKRDRVPQLDSAANQLKARGYRTLFFTTHDEEFDNMAGFLRQNGYGRVVAQDDYPSDRVFSILGVPDHDMYLKAVEVLDGESAHGPFFAALLSGSNHRPYVIPPELRERFAAKDEKENIVRYSDWAVGAFIEAARTRPWFKDTLFVFLADHGQSVGTSPLDQILSYHHMPLVFWSPTLVPSPQTVPSPVAQIDVLPTALGYLRLAYQNATLGRDVLKQPRPWVYVVRDNAACALTPRLLECEAQDGSMSRFPLGKAEWEALEPMPAALWRQIHAELQLADGVLRSR